jgi:hydrogenase-4 component F
MRIEEAHGRLTPGRLRLYHAMFQLFMATMLTALTTNNMGLLWVAMEAATLSTVLLVTLYRTPASLEAGWKYFILCGVGIAQALFGTILLYFAAEKALGAEGGTALLWTHLNGVKGQLEPTVLALAFVFLLVGYGTKVGLAPMHTWLPDAHSEGPAPVSAMLSGALLNTAMLGIVRFLAATDAAGRGLLPRTALIVLGVLSLLIGALFIVRQRQIKRLMAYSSIEHMGVLALGFGFGGSLGIAGALYHMLNHSLCKPLLFFGAGNAIHRFHSKRIEDLRDMFHVFPLSGWLWLCAAVAITGAPPFGLFLSEWSILRAGWASPNAWAAVVMLVLLVIIFVAFLNHFRAMYLATRRMDDVMPARSSDTAWRVWPMALALAPLLVLGITWPAAWLSLFQRIAAQLGATP